MLGFGAALSTAEVIAIWLVYRAWGIGPAAVGLVVLIGSGIRWLVAGLRSFREPTIQECHACDSTAKVGKYKAVLLWLGKDAAGRAMSYRASDLAGDLRRLLALPLRDKKDLEAWHDEAAPIQARLMASGAQDPIRESLRRFFMDPDLRLKDGRLREIQEQQVLMVIRDLEQRGLE